MGTSAAVAPTGKGYQSLLVGLLGVNIGIVFLDRTAFGLLAPMIQPEFGLNNTQIGLISGALALGWALSSFGLTRAADATGKAKALLVGATIVFSLASISSGLAIGFLTMMAARVVMGLAEGGLPPLTFHIVTSEVPPERRGLAVGLTSTIGLQAIPALGPLVIVGVGAAWGWREAFWVAGIPGLVMAAAIWMLIRNPPHERPADADRGAVGPLLKIRNIRFSLVLAALNMTFYGALLGFGPLYLVQVAGFSDVSMGAAMTGIGIVGVFFAFVGPMLSDRYGRKPVIFVAYAIAIAGGLMMALGQGSMPLVFSGALLSAAGGAGTGALIMAIIPGESAPPHLKGTAMGFNAAVGEIIGGGLMPIVIGVAADRLGLDVLPWLMVAVGAMFCLLSFALRETAPAVLAQRTAEAA